MAPGRLSKLLTKAKKIAKAVKKGGSKLLGQVAKTASAIAPVLSVINPVAGRIASAAGDVAELTSKDIIEPMEQKQDPKVNDWTGGLKDIFKKYKKFKNQQAPPPPSPGRSSAPPPASSSASDDEIASLGEPPEPELSEVD